MTVLLDYSTRTKLFPDKKEKLPAGGFYFFQLFSIKFTAYHSPHARALAYFTLPVALLSLSQVHVSAHDSSGCADGGMRELRPGYISGCATTSRGGGGGWGAAYSGSGATQREHGQVSGKEDRGGVFG